MFRQAAAPDPGGRGHAGHQLRRLQVGVTCHVSRVTIHVLCRQCQARDRRDTLEMKEVTSMNGSVEHFYISTSNVILAQSLPNSVMGKGVIYCCSGPGPKHPDKTWDLWRTNVVKTSYFKSSQFLYYLSMPVLFTNNVSNVQYLRPWYCV